jgi:AraC family transcriptional regulator of adaptative response/methylated-DNA-[protein]-cysteine methyltransferase
VQLFYFISFKKVMYLCTQNGKVMKNDETSKKVKKHHDIVSIKYADNKEFKSKRRPIHISFSIHNTKIGKLVVASTAKGICYVGYPIKGLTYVEQLKERFPNAKIKNRIAKINPLIREALKKEWDKNLKIPLHLEGTPFQYQVWEALLQIPHGELTTYAQIAQQIGKPKAQRAVGNAVGRNPILFLIPCHRVVTSQGKLGGFYWGIDKKVFLLNKESTYPQKGKLVWNPTFF